MKALVGTFNQEKAFSVVVNTNCETDALSAALVTTVHDNTPSTRPDPRGKSTHISILDIEVEAHNLILESVELPNALSVFETIFI